VHGWLDNENQMQKTSLGGGRPSTGAEQDEHEYGHGRSSALISLRERYVMFDHTCICAVRCLIAAVLFSSGVIL